MGFMYFSSLGFLFFIYVIIPGTTAIYSGPSPPKITEYSKDYHIFYTTGKSLVLPCRATGTGDLRYSWTKDGLAVTDLLLSNTTEDCNDTGGCSLRFESLQAVHDGLYQCTVNNKYGLSISHHVRLHQAVIGKGDCGYSARQRQLARGQFVKLPCCQPQSVPPAKFRWTVGSFVDGELRSEQKPVVLDKYIKMDHNGTLYILEANDATIEDKIYQCHIYNDELKSHFERSFITSLSNKTDTIPHEKPRLRKAFRRDSVVSLLGEDVQLQCIFDARPIPKVEWSKVNKNFPPDSHQNTSGLFIHNIQKQDGGSYMCKGTNYLGSDKELFNVDVQYKPYFVSRPSDVIAPAGETVKFICEADGNPSASVTWSVNGVPIQGGLDRVSISQSGSGSNLTVESVCIDHCNELGSQARDSDIMVFQCNASNVHGYTLTEAILNVIDKIHIRRPPENISITGTWTNLRERPAERLECEAVYNKYAPTSVKWYHNQSEILFQTQEIYSQDAANSLMINFKGLSYGDIWTVCGIYKCKVDNSYEEVEAEATLNLDLLPELSTKELSTAEELFPTPEVYTMSEVQIEDENIILKNKSKAMIRPFNSPVLYDRPRLELPTTDETGIHDPEEEQTGKSDDEGGWLSNIIFLVGSSVGAAVFITCLIMVGVCVRRCGRKKRKTVRRSSSAAGSERYEMGGSQYWTLSNKSNHSMTKSQLEAGDNTLRSFSLSSGEEEDMPNFLPVPPPPEEFDLPPPPPPEPYSSEWSLHPKTNMDFYA